MADAPKGAPKDKKPAGGGTPLSPFENAVWYFFILLFAVSLLSNVFGGSGSFSGTAGGWWHAFVRFLALHIVPILFVIAFILSILFALGIIMALRKLSIARAAHDAFYNPSIAVKADGAVLLEEPKNPQWDRVMNHLNSKNANDWKFAIIEADIMLDDLLDTLQYHGDSIGDKLNEAEKGGMKTIDNAWEAHKVRNQIAHEGADFLLSEREARRVIELYRSVFAEFRII